MILGKSLCFSLPRFPFHKLQILTLPCHMDVARICLVQTLWHPHMTVMGAVRMLGHQVYTSVTAEPRPRFIDACFVINIAQSHRIEIGIRRRDEDRKRNHLCRP